MSDKVLNSETIFVAAMQLTKRERRDLAHRLMDSLPEEAGLSLEDPNLLPELERRFADQSGAQPWSELREEI